MQLDTIRTNIKVVRDDLFPFLGGGNKGRKVQNIEKDILKKGGNAVVTTGGIESNHCRAVAIMAAKHNWACTLILHGDEEEFYKSCGNALFMRSTNATITFVEPSDIGSSMDFAMEEYRNQNLTPYYIWGGGHTLEGGLAYIDAIQELKEICTLNNWWPDYIFLASGTGSTQAGIMAGLDKEKLNTKVIGISVARERNRAEEVVSEFYSKLCKEYAIKSTDKKAVVLDDYLFGGYEGYNDQLQQLSQNSLKRFGFCLDTTYSGKAFYGMMDYIKNNDISGNVLFWHTGGILNFITQQQTKDK